MQHSYSIFTSSRKVLEPQVKTITFDKSHSHCNNFVRAKHFYKPSSGFLTDKTTSHIFLSCNNLHSFLWTCQSAFCHTRQQHTASLHSIHLSNLFFIWYFVTSLIVLSLHPQVKKQLKTMIIARTMTVLFQFYTYHI